jgi:hypothetical protein
MTDKEIEIAKVELQFTVAKLRAAQVELLLLEEEDQDNNFRDIIKLLENTILELQTRGSAKR